MERTMRPSLCCESPRASSWFIDLGASLCGYIISASKTSFASCTTDSEIRRIFSLKKNAIRNLGQRERWTEGSAGMLWGRTRQEGRLAQDYSRETLRSEEHTSELQSLRHL